MNNATTSATKIATKPNFRTNKDQVIDFFGHGVHTVKFMGVCPVSGIRMYDMPGSPYPDHDYTYLEAKDYGMKGPDFMISYLASNDSVQYHRAVELAQRTWVDAAIKTLYITGKRWFQKTYGNTYFSARAFIDGKEVASIDFAYGYSDQYEWEMFRKLSKMGFIDEQIKYGNGGTESPNLCAERLGIEYRAHAVDVDRRKDL